MEVLISVSLLSVIITTMFQIKENNLFFLSKFSKSSKNNEYMSLSTIAPINITKLRNDNIYLDKIVDFNDDDIRKELKNIKVNIKDENINDIDFSTEDFIIKIKIFESIYKIEDKIQKDIYTFKLDY